MNHTAGILFERYHVAVYRYFRRMTGRHEAAQDLTQELFLRVVRALKTYAATGRDAEWVFRIARNLAVDYRRRATTRAEVDLADAAPARTEATQVVAFGVSEALALLGEPERETLLLREFVGLTYDELSRVCQVGPEVISRRLHRARTRLRHLLSTRLRAEDSQNSREDG
jgi:RNA polymerase sigma-70 factor (ECF subfamily)